MITAGIAVLSGTLLACLLPQRIDIFWVSFFPVCFYFAYINTRWRFFWLVVISFLWTTVHINSQLDQRLNVESNNKRLTVVGEVVNIPQTSFNTTRFLFKPTQITAYTQKLPGLIKINWRKPPFEVMPGQIWQLTVKLKQPHGYQNPSGFDYERWLFVKGIHATGYVITSEGHELLGTNHLSVNKLRYIVRDAIKSYCHDCPNIGLIQALTLGYRGDIKPSHRDDLQQTGTAHLVAISGLHIGIMAGVFYSLGLWLWNRLFYRSRINRREFALLLSWVAALSYSLLAGFDLPAQRAMLMLTVIFVSLWVRTPFSLLNSISIALVLVLASSPLSVLSESFWLTFTALFIILLGSFLLKKQNSKIKQLFLIQLLFSLLFIPVSILIFGQIHIAALLANLIAVPLVALVIVPVNFMLLTLLWLPDHWLEWLYPLVDSALGYLMSYLHVLQEIGLQALAVPEIGVWSIFLVTLLLLMWVLPQGLLPGKRWSLLLLVIIFWPRDFESAHKLKLTILDVGMGTSIVVQTQHHSLIYDFGPGNDRGYSLGKWVLMPFLRAEGLDYIDRIIFSHSDQDHAGGFYAIHQKLQYGWALSGTAEQIKTKFSQIGPVQDCHQQQEWHWDGVKFEFLSSDVDTTGKENNRSCVLKISFGNESILLTGDIEKEQEFKLLRTHKDQLSAEILIAPHHGSLTSSSPEMVQAVNAKHVIFTSGFLNRWAFPRPAVLDRYLQTSAKIYRTDTDGAVSVNCDKNHCKIDRFRQQRPRLWY